MNSPRISTSILMAVLLLALQLGTRAVYGYPGAAAPNESKKELREEIRQLQQRVLELQRKAAVTEVEMSRLRAAVEALQAGRGSEPQVSQRTTRPSRSSETAETIPGAPRVVFDEARVQRTSEDRSGVRDRTSSLPEVGLEEEAPPELSEPVSLGTAGQALYDRGYTLYHQGQFVEAEAAFQRFLEAFGETDLADNAQYWIGEARYSRGDLRGALAAFRETIERHPKGNKVPDALLKSGRCLEDLGDLAGARAAYKEIQDRYPQTATALIAAERLADQG